MRRLILLLCLALAAVGPLRASSAGAEVAGVHLPGQVSVAGRELVLNGAGLRRMLLFRVYVAALYLPERRHDSHAVLDPDLPRSLRLALLRDLSTEQNLDALRGGLMANNSPAELAAIDGEVERFLDYIRQVREAPAGTVIRLDYQPGAGTHVIVNGHPLGIVPGEAFNRALLKIWLGEDPVQGSLKQALLGMAE